MTSSAVSDRSFQIGASQIAPHALIARASEMSDAIALTNVATHTDWTYQELLSSVRQFASALVAAGVQPGDFVMTMLLDQADGIRAWLGAAFAGAIEVPINPQHRGDMLRTLLRHVSPRVLVLDPAVRAEINPDDLAGVETILTTDDGALGRSDERTASEGASPRTSATVTEPPHAKAGDVAAVIFTSGTTGPSKAAMVTWASVYQMVSWLPPDAYQSGDGVYCPIPMFHLAAKSNFANTLERGARFVYRPKFSASSFLDDVRATNCTTANIVGPMLSVLWNTPARPDDALGPLRVIACGPMIPDVEAFKQRFGVEIVTCYGMTEIGCVLTTGYNHGPWNACGRVRADYPWPEVRIVDAEGRDVKQGDVGELIARPYDPAGFSPGYLNDPEGTAEAWRDGWFHSGDALRMDEDGNFFLVDRYKDAMRRKGENVSSFEIETVVASHDLVAECAAVGVPGAHGDDDIVIFLTPSGTDPVDTEAIRHWVDQRVPSHMRPTEYRVVDDFPRNATTMRIKKYELRRIARGG